MYNANQNNNTNYQRNTFNWGEFFSRAIIVILFIFILMWIAPLPTKISSVDSKVGGLEGKVDGIEGKVNILVDRVFFDNIELMKNTAKEYWTIPKLPQNVDDIKTLTLQEMIDKKLILAFTDKNGKACDSAKSKVEIKRLEKEYQITTTLVCDDQSDYIVSYMDLECNKGCDCVLKEKDPDPVVSKYTVYQFARTVTDTYWTDWTDWTTEKKEADDTQTKTEYKGKKWISVPEYEYEFTKTTPGEKVCKIVTTPGERICNSVNVPGERVCETVEIPGGTTTEWVPEVVKNVKDCHNEQVCKTEKYVIGTKQVRSCNTCEIEIVTIYGTRKDCSGTKRVCETVPKVVKAGYYKTIVLPPKYKRNCYTTNSTTRLECYTTTGTNTEVCTTTPGTTKTTWSKEKTLEGWTYTGNKRVVGDNGHYEYTEWVSSLEEGYEQTEVRTLYRYRTKKTTSKVEYMWSRNKEVPGWTFTGKFENRTETK